MKLSMPYGIGFNHTEINAKCRRQCIRKDSHNRRTFKKNFKLAGLSVLKQKTAIDKLKSVNGPLSEEKVRKCDNGEIKETIVTLDKKGEESVMVIGGKIFRNIFPTKMCHILVRRTP